MDDPGPVSAPPKTRPRAHVLLVALAPIAAGLLLLAAWPARPARPRATSPSPSLAHTPSRSPAHPPASASALALTQAPSPAAPASTTAALHPLQHPITPDHLRLYRDVDLLDEAWQALKTRDFARARAVLARHKSEYPSAHDDLNEGLTLLADCMQQRSPAARARAQRFYDEHTSSMARRRIRRECLEAVR